MRSSTSLIRWSRPQRWSEASPCNDPRARYDISTFGPSSVARWAEPRQGVVRPARGWAGNGVRSRDFPGSEVGRAVNVRRRCSWPILRRRRRCRRRRIRQSSAVGLAVVGVGTTASPASMASAIAGLAGSRGCHRDDQCRGCKRGGCAAGPRSHSARLRARGRRRSARPVRRPTATVRTTRPCVP